jgi:hypothetical protein
MSNLFQEVLTDAKGVENDLLGPAYPYYQNIKTPAQLGMGTEGNIQQMTKDIDGLIDYVEVLVSGNSAASSTGKPLGDKFFLQTGAKCAAIDTCTDPSNVSTCQQTDRYIYINNVPSGDIPFISSGMGVSFTDFEGLIPGAMGNLNVLNPFSIMQAFLSGATPLCQELTMQTISTTNAVSSETNYVTLVDIANMDACTFPNGKNPVTGVSCVESFQNNELKIPDNPLAQLYFASLGILGLFILYRLMEKSE